MPLTPEDVQNKRFSTVRFKEGYDEEEVDAFLDEVEAELRRLLGENTDLRARPAGAAGFRTRIPHPAQGLPRRPAARPRLARHGCSHPAARIDCRPVGPSRRRTFGGADPGAAGGGSAARPTAGRGAARPARSCPDE